MLNSTSAWSASVAVPDEYMIMDLGRVSKIEGVISQGRKDKPFEFVKTFTVQYSIDGSSWQDIPGTFKGGSQEVKGIFPKMVEAHYLKLAIKSWSSWISMRAGALLCNKAAPTAPKFACNSILFNPTESDRSYSSVYQNEAPGIGHARSMLDSPQGWSAAVKAAGEYMIMDMKEIALISGVVVQGRKDKPWEFVRRFEVQYSLDGSTWLNVSQTFFFAHKPYRHMIRRWTFKELVKARFLKLVALSWNSWVSMRAGVFLCDTS